VWQYIHKEALAIVPLYYAAKRPVERNGALSMIDDERMQLHPGEKPQRRSVRFRTLGCGELVNFTGIDSSYEVPETPDVHLDASGAVSADANADAVLAYLRRAGVLAPATDAP
jgi:hypothetical protein